MSIKIYLLRIFRHSPETLHIASLLSIIFITFMIRVLPIRWGVILTEFDPWMHFAQAKFIVDRGWSGFLEYFSWIDHTRWYPYGQFVSKTFYPGLSFMLAFLYLSLKTIGINVDLMELAVIFPAILSIVSIIAVYFLGREIGGKTVGLVSALILAISNAYISRALAGWFDDESISIPLILLGFLFYIKAIKKDRSVMSTVAFSVLAGLSLGYLTTCWGAHRFPIAFIPIITVLLSFIGRYRRQFIIAFPITFCIYTTIGALVPKHGGISYLGELSISIGFIAIIILAIFELSSRLKSEFLKSFIPRAFTIVFPLVMLMLASLPGIKFLSTLAPWIRSDLPILISVAENQIGSWYTMISDLGLFLIFVPIGIFFALKSGTDEAISISLFTVLSIYFASSMVRLSTFAAPFVAIMGGYVLATLFENVGKAIKIRQLRKKEEEIAIEYKILTPILIVLVISISIMPSFIVGRTFGRLSPIDQAYMPATVVHSTIPAPIVIPDWMNALAWMRDNLPSNAVVASWWDYGYWITFIGNKTTLIDNSTTNSTQIGAVALAFMSPPDKAIEILRSYGVTHVVIFVTLEVYRYGTDYMPRLLGFGDEAKWAWMLRIANQEAEKFGITPMKEEDYFDQIKGPVMGAKDKFWSETLLGQLIPYKPRTIQDQVAHYYSDPNVPGFKLVYSSSDPYTSYAYVYVYELVA